MAEYVDLDAVITAQLYDDEHEDYVNKEMTVRDYLRLGCDRIPLADVAEVVRCKDCKHRGEHTDCPFCWLTDMEMGDEHFCSYGYGERRADG